MTESETSSLASQLDWDTVELLDQDEQVVSSKQLLGDVSAERRAVWMTRLASNEGDEQLTDEDRVIAVMSENLRHIM